MSAVIPSPVPLLNGLVGTILGHQIQLAIAQTQSIENHRHRRRTSAYDASLLSCLFIQPLRYPRFLAYPCYSPSMVQAFYLVLQVRHILLPLRLFPYLTFIPFFRQPFCGMWDASSMGSLF
jgi:hypothetical protein